MKTHKNLDSTIKRILKEVITENITPNQQAAMDAGYGPVSTQYADQLVSSGKVKVGAMASAVQKVAVPLIQADTNTQNAGDKINTTNDKAYDYKLSGGKYYFKGKANTTYATKFPNWTEATGKGLEAIKSKVKFDSSSNTTSQTPQPTPTPTPQPTQTIKFDYKNPYQTQKDNTYVKPIIPYNYKA